jgi:diaminopimelate dehydrogenase
MARIKVAVVGYGNVGQGAIDAILAAPDMELTGLVRRSVKGALPPALRDIKVVEDISQLPGTQVAVLCIPTRAVAGTAPKILAQGINTVDSYDVHGTIQDLRRELGTVAAAHNSVAIISAGWDPGSDSMVRTLFEVIAPKGLSYTNFGPGMSMGHTVAVKAIPGVKNALSMTIPIGQGMHRRMVYVELNSGVDFGGVERAIKQDPYFIHDETHVFQVSDVAALLDTGHGVVLERKGVSGRTHNQMMKLEMRINNPAATGQIMVSAARASLQQKPGAYTLIEVPLIDFLPGEKEEIIQRLV